jgi:hypothetical protein
MTDENNLLISREELEILFPDIHQRYIAFEVFQRIAQSLSERNVIYSEIENV